MFKFKERAETKNIDVILTNTGEEELTVRQLRATYKQQGSFEIKSHFVVTKDGTLTTIRDVSVVSGVGEDNVVILVVGSEVNELQQSTINNLVEKLLKLFPEVESVSYKE